MTDKKQEEINPANMSALFLEEVVKRVCSLATDLCEADAALTYAVLRESARRAELSHSHWYFGVLGKTIKEQMDTKEAAQ